MISDQIKPYQFHPEAWIISCYFNPGNFASRRANFAIFYEQLRRSGVNFLIAECAFGENNFELPDDRRILRFRSKHKMWHKERLLNLLIKRLPSDCRYVFWLDADVLLKNSDWIIEAVQKLTTATICQPFSVAVRLEKDQIEPNFNVRDAAILLDFPNIDSIRQTVFWRSFAYNYQKNRRLSENELFDVHGHTGFAWGARREILERVPLFDKAIVGTSDHIMAHATAGQIPHNCLEKAFTDQKVLKRIYQWSGEFSRATRNELEFVEGELWHLWHGDLKDRQYLQRTRDFGEIDFDLDDELLINDDDLFEFPESRADIENWMNDYFESRREDHIPEEDAGVSHSPESSDNYSPAETDQMFGSESDSGGGFDGGGAGGSWENYS